MKPEPKAQSWVLNKVAILAATEMVNPKIPVTLDVANLAKMADQRQIKDNKDQRGFEGYGGLVVATSVALSMA